MSAPPGTENELVATMQPAGAAPEKPGPQGLPLRVWRLLRSYATVVLLIVLCIVFTFASPSFLTTQNWTNLLVTQSVIGCIAFAALFPLIVGEFDLSLGYMVGFITMLGAYVASGAGSYNATGQSGSATEVVGVMVAAGILLGLINGILTVYFKISSFISTLGVGIFLSGLALALSGGQVLFAGIPGLVTGVGRDHFAGVAISVWLVLALGLILLYVFEHTPLGRQWYAIGGSERVAFLAGVPTKLLKVLAFVMAGLLVSIGAIFELGSAGAANPTFGPDLLLPAYAAAFLGVTTYKLGYYNVLGTIIAILVLAVGFNGLSLLGVPFWGQPLFNGAVLLVAVLAARAEARHVRVG